MTLLEELKSKLMIPDGWAESQDGRAECSQLAHDVATLDREAFQSLSSSLNGVTIPKWSRGAIDRRKRMKD
jgi:hypothetical protein